ncbi:hypothetical protein A2U01_0071451, partial [Trifolium medium]|nr:hypothetical protein [Trifolium medium]
MLDPGDDGGVHESGDSSLCFSLRDMGNLDPPPIL